MRQKKQKCKLGVLNEKLSMTAMQFKEKFIQICKVHFKSKKVIGDQQSILILFIKKDIKNGRKNLTLGLKNDRKS